MSKPDLEDCRDQVRQNLPAAHERAIQKLQGAEDYYEQIASVVRTSSSLTEIQERIGRLPSARLDIEWGINVNPALRQAGGLSPELSLEEINSQVLEPIERIRSTYGKTLEGLSKGDFQYECEYRGSSTWYYEYIQGCDPDTSAWVSKNFPSVSDIHICVDNIDPHNVEELANSIVHEASHKFGGTTDDLLDKVQCAYNYELSTSLLPRDDWGWKSDEPAPWEPLPVSHDAPQTSAADYFTADTPESEDFSDAGHQGDPNDTPTCSPDLFTGQPDSGAVAGQISDGSDAGHITGGSDADTCSLDYFTVQPDSGTGAGQISDGLDAGDITGGHDAETCSPDYFTVQPDDGAGAGRMSDGSDAGHIIGGNDAATCSPDVFTGQPDRGPGPDTGHISDGSDATDTGDYPQTTAGDYFTGEADSGDSCPAPDTLGGPDSGGISNGG